MNETSSRAHTIVTIYFRQKLISKTGDSISRVSEINLVDLAGSERAKTMGRGGSRLTEGTAINVSLHTLGRCITALAEQSKKGGEKVHVPYRESALTKLLNSVGGNSKTLMIAAISPADINYAESLSTLRYADQMKAIKTKAVINENATDKLIRELRAEIERLKKLLENGGGSGNSMDLQKFEQELAFYRDGFSKFEEEKRKFEEKLKLEKLEKEKESLSAHLWNINEDPALCGLVKHRILKSEKMIKIGMQDDNDIVLEGQNIFGYHAEIENTDDKRIFIRHLNGSMVLLNGKQLETKTELNHNDRILFGNTHLYAFSHPIELKKNLKSLNRNASYINSNKNGGPTYFEAMNEITRNGEGAIRRTIAVQTDIHKAKCKVCTIN